MPNVLDLGVLAHVDAGKTSVTEQFLFRAGVTGRLGRVDDGTTQTDSLELERRRGITIRSAVVSFFLEDLGAVMDAIRRRLTPHVIAVMEAWSPPANAVTPIRSTGRPTCRPFAADLAIRPSDRIRLLPSRAGLGCATRHLARGPTA